MESMKIDTNIEGKLAEPCGQSVPKLSQDISELAARAFEAEVMVKMLSMMNTPEDYDKRKEAFIELELAKKAAADALWALRSAQAQPPASRADDLDQDG